MKYDFGMRYLHSIQFTWFSDPDFCYEPKTRQNGQAAKPRLHEKAE